MDQYTRDFLQREDLLTAIDISKWQGAWVDPHTTAEHADFIYMRGCNGSREDKRLPEFASKAKDVGLDFGLYVFVRPGKSADAQANLICDLSDKYGATLAPMIDVEHHDGKTRQQQQVHLQRVLSIVRQRRGIPCIYTAAWYWNVHIQSIPEQELYPLWVARYFSMSESPTPGQWREWSLAKGKRVNTPTGWDGYGALQFSADGNNWGRRGGFSSSHLDLNLVSPEFFAAVKGETTLTLPTPAPKPVKEEPKFDRNLRRGHKGTDVKALQAALKVLSPVDPGPLDGWFGPRTEVSLRAFQKSRGLVVDGWAGKQTFGQIAKELK